MVICNEAYEELVAIMGKDNVSIDPQILDSYAVQPFHRGDQEKWIPRPAAVILPGCTEEVAAAVKVINKYHYKFKAHSTGFGAQSGPGCEGVVQVDLRRMNHLVKIDEKNMYAVIEPYVSQMEIEVEAWKHGLTFMLITAGPQTSNLASLTSHEGSGSCTASMGYNGRNLLGFEWVSPEGEIIRAGSADMDADWFSCDGPGPSMKGIVRGQQGYDGGFGIFTKATVKLYHFNGPKDLSFLTNGGSQMEIDADIPENIHHYTLFLEDFEKLAEAFYKISESEIAWSCYKMPLGFVMLSYLNEAMQKMARQPILRKMVQAGVHKVNLILVGNSPKDMEYKVKCLKQIVEETGAICLGGHPESHYDKAMCVATMRGTDYLNLFNGPGTFHVAMAADESIDAACEQSRLAASVKEELIKDDLTSDDFGDGSWSCFRDHGAWCHGEALLQYDPKVARFSPSMEIFSQKCSDYQLNNHLGGLGFSIYGGEETVMKFNAECYNFFHHVERIREIWDPNGVGNQCFT